MGAPQFLQRPPNASHVTSGMFRYHGMEYLQCGQCDFGVTMLRPSGSRWMHTFRKLPTMQPSTKKTSDQKWNGTAAQSAVHGRQFTVKNTTPMTDINPLVRPWTVDCRLWTMDCRLWTE